MAFTQTQLDLLDAAIVTGELSVEYPNGSVKYRSLDEMFRIRDLMANELGVNDSKVTRHYASTSKGL